jgi:hypothetical protein
MFLDYDDSEQIVEENIWTESRTTIRRMDKIA